MSRYVVFKGTIQETENFLNTITENCEIVAQQIDKNNTLVTTIRFYEEKIQETIDLGELKQLVQDLYKNHQQIKEELTNITEKLKEINESDLFEPKLLKF